MIRKVQALFLYFCIPLLIVYQFIHRLVIVARSHLTFWARIIIIGIFIGASTPVYIECYNIVLTVLLVVMKVSAVVVVRETCNPYKKTIRFCVIFETDIFCWKTLNGLLISRGKIQLTNISTPIFSFFLKIKKTFVWLDHDIT